MLTLVQRSYRGEVDLSAIATLINTCETVDHGDEPITTAQLQEKFNAPFFDKSRDIGIWESNSGEILGFSQFWAPQRNAVIDGWLWFRVHPQARGKGLDEQIVAWAETRMREVQQECAAQVILRAAAQENRSDRISLLQRCGFTADRYYYRMARSLVTPFADPQLPPGFTLRELQDQSEAIAFVELYNQSFIDHWNHQPLTLEFVQHELTKSDYRPDLDLVAVAPDGTLAAFCHSSIQAQNNEQTQRKEGWIGALGTRRGFRKQGLGRALLLAGMQRLKAAGMETALLAVDTQNPSGALRLYESVGFTKDHTTISFSKKIEQD